MYLHLDPVDLPRDAEILRADVAQEVDLVDEVGQVTGREQDIERRRLAGLVDLHEPLVEPAECDRVLVPEEVKALGLEREELRDPGQLLPVQSEVALERLQPGGDVADPGFEAPDARLDRADL